MRKYTDVLEASVEGRGKLPCDIAFGGVLESFWNPTVPSSKVPELSGPSTGRDTGFTYRPEKKSGDPSRKTFSFNTFHIMVIHDLPELEYLHDLGNLETSTSLLI